MTTGIPTRSIAQLPVASSVSGNDTVIISQNGITKSATVTQTNSAPINDSTFGGFWQGTSPGGNPKFYRMRDRIFVANAVGMGDTRSNTNSTWVPNTSAGANWAPRDSQLCVMQDVGGLAVTGMSRGSDGDSISNPPTTIGVAGFVINNTAVAKNAWALYADVQHEPVSVSCISFGLEIAGKNKSSDQIPTAYGLGYGVHGVWLAGGGDSAYGGSPTNPATAGITFTKNASTWNAGIVFGANSLTGSDGITGTANAIEMAKGHTIRWRGPSGILAATITSEIDTSGKQVGILFGNDAVVFTGNEGTPIGRVIRGSSGTPANFVQLSSNATGNGPRVQAVGSDTNVDLRLVPQGTGVVSFGTHSIIGAETLTGYITIKDSGGVSRKIAVVS